MAMGRILFGLGHIGSKVAAASKGRDWSGILPRERRPTRRVRTDSPVTPASGLTSESTRRWKIFGDIWSGPAAALGFMHFTALRTEGSSTSGAGGKSVAPIALIGWVGAGCRFSSVNSVLGSVRSAMGEFILTRIARVYCAWDASLNVLAVRRERDDPVRGEGICCRYHSSLSLCAASASCQSSPHSPRPARVMRRRSACICPREERHPLSPRKDFRSTTVGNMCSCRSALCTSVGVREAAAARMIRMSSSTVECMQGFGMSWNMSLGRIGVLRSSSGVGRGAGGPGSSGSGGVVRLKRCVRV